MQDNNIKNMHHGCPIVMMTSDEILRYLQQGYDSAVQTAIETHVKACSLCQDLLIRHKNAIDTARLILNASTTYSNHSQHGNHLDAMTLAAFHDKALSENEYQNVKHHLSHCVVCFQEYNGLIVQMGTQISNNLKTPNHIKQTLKVKPFPLYTRGSKSVREYLGKLFDRIQQLLEQRWTVPVLGFATGIILMVWLGSFQENKFRMTVVLPQARPVSSEINIHALSGLPSDSATDTENPFVTEIPLEAKQTVIFQWQDDELCEQYRIGFYDGSGNLIKHEVTTENSLKVSSTELIVKQICMINVLGINKNGGIKLISRLRFRLTE